jgi:hypothetical protein
MEFIGGTKLLPVVATSIFKVKPGVDGVIHAIHHETLRPTPLCIILIGLKLLL